MSTSGLRAAVANALVIPFIAVATARNTGWTIDMHVSRGAVFHSTAILVSGVFLLVVAGAGYIVRFLGGEWGRALQIELVFAALLLGVLGITSGSFRSKLRVFVSKHFFSYRYDYREEWLRFTRTLVGRDVVARRSGAKHQGAGGPGRKPGRRALAEAGGRGFSPGFALEHAGDRAVEPAQGSLSRFLERTGWVIDLNEYAADRTRYPELEVPRVARRDAVGVAGRSARFRRRPGRHSPCLRRSRATIEVNWEVRDLLKTASRQAASYLGQIRATDALLEARKFDAFNRMSAFVVHDLKNLVAQLSLMLRNAERHRDNPEFQRDMLTTVEHVVGRMNHLMLQLRTGATPLEKPRLTDLEAIVRRVCAALAEPAWADRTRPRTGTARHGPRGQAGPRDRASGPERARRDGRRRIRVASAFTGTAPSWCWKYAIPVSA